MIYTDTHPNFKSLYNNITNAREMVNTLVPAFIFQENILNKQTTIKDYKEFWKRDEKLKNFIIHPSEVDRLYQFYKKEEKNYISPWIEIYKMAGRIQKDGEQLYVELQFYMFNYSFFRNECTYKRSWACGKIFVTKCFDTFFKFALSDSRELRQFLKVDGITIKKSPFTLQDLCIQKYHIKFKNETEKLPFILKKTH